MKITHAFWQKTFNHSCRCTKMRMDDSKLHLAFQMQIFFMRCVFTISNHFLKNMRQFFEDRTMDIFQISGPQINMHSLSAKTHLYSMRTNKQHHCRVRNNSMSVICFPKRQQQQKAPGNFARLHFCQKSTLFSTRCGDGLGRMG